MHRTRDRGMKVGVMTHAPEPIGRRWSSEASASRTRMTLMHRWMFALPIVLILQAAVIVFAFNRTGPTANQNTHAQETGQSR